MKLKILIITGLFLVLVIQILFVYKGFDRLSPSDSLIKAENPLPSFEEAASPGTLAEPSAHMGEGEGGGFDTAPFEEVEASLEAPPPEIEISEAIAMKAFHDPKTLSEVFALPERESAGNLRGFRLVAIQKASVFDWIGLKPQDLIVSINGRPLKSTSELEAAFRQFEKRRVWSVDLMRGSNLYSIRIRLKEPD